MKRYCAVDLVATKESGLSVTKWLLLENITFLSAYTGWCERTRQELAEHHNISVQRLRSIISELEADKWLLKNKKFHLKATKKWVNLQSTQKQAPPYSKTSTQGTQKRAPSTYKKEYKIEGLNENAFKMWCNYKGKSYKQQGKTLSANLLKKHTEDIQMKMVEKSIMNNWQGLFEIDSVQAKKKEVLI